MKLPLHVIDAELDVLEDEAMEPTQQQQQLEGSSKQKEDDALHIHTSPVVISSSPTIMHKFDDFSISSIGTDDDSFLMKPPITSETKMRLNEEKDLIKKFDRPFINPSNECWFLVDAEFLTHAARYVQGSITHPPPPLSTRNLLDGVSKKPIPGLICGMDYRGVTPLTYFVYTALYGKDESSPEICRFIVNIYAKEVPAGRKKEIIRNARRLAQVEVQQMQERIEAANVGGRTGNEEEEEGGRRRVVSRMMMGPDDDDDERRNAKQGILAKLCCCLRIFSIARRRRRREDTGWSRRMKLSSSSNRAEETQACCQQEEQEDNEEEIAEEEEEEMMDQKHENDMKSTDMLAAAIADSTAENASSTDKLDNIKSKEEPEGEEIDDNEKLLLIGGGKAHKKGEKSKKRTKK